jgi:hypothetical protein
MFTAFFAKKGSLYISSPHLAQKIERITRSGGAPAIRKDGQYIAFDSQPTNRKMPVTVRLIDRKNHLTKDLGNGTAAQFSNSGRLLAFLRGNNSATLSGYNLVVIDVNAAKVQLSLYCTNGVKFVGWHRENLILIKGNTLLVRKANGDIVETPRELSILQEIIHRSANLSLGGIEKICCSDESKFVAILASNRKLRSSHDGEPLSSVFKLNLTQRNEPTLISQNMACYSLDANSGKICFAGYEERDEGAAQSYLHDIKTGITAGFISGASQVAMTE